MRKFDNMKNIPPEELLKAQQVLSFSFSFSSSEWSFSLIRFFVFWSLGVDGRG
jgi:hypothetical protein